MMLERIEKVFKEHTGNDDLTITQSTTFAELGLDSLDTVELVMELEDEFDAKIEMDESLKSVDDLIKILENA